MYKIKKIGYFVCIKLYKKYFDIYVPNIASVIEQDNQK